MEREIKRVPLEFQWPINQIWRGYWHPFRAQKCKACEGSGLNPEYKKLHDDWYLHKGAGWQHALTQDEVDMLYSDGRLRDFQSKPTAKEVNEWSRHGFGHDSINHFKCTEYRANRLGISQEPCKYCDGDGSFYPNAEIKKLSDDWEGFDPPEGEGYQLWETTSDGSPISPVFNNPENLARWLTDNNASAFGNNTASYEQWLKFICGPGWAPSAVFGAGKLSSGVESL